MKEPAIANIHFWGFYLSLAKIGVIWAELTDYKGVGEQIQIPADSGFAYSE
jgi:hypothetical protein